MIIQHQGQTFVGYEIVRGYAIEMGDKAYIRLEDGRMVQVRKSTVYPVIKDDIALNTEKNIWEDGKHPLCCLDMSSYILDQMRENGAVCLEDLERWTDRDFKKIRGLGKLKIKKVLETLQRYGIEIKNA